MAPAYATDSPPWHNPESPFLNSTQNMQVHKYNGFYYFLQIFDGSKTFDMLNNAISYNIYTSGDPIVRVVGAGDSLNTGFDSTSDCTFVDCHDNTWATGAKVNSIHKRISVLNNQPTEAMNVAQTGSTVSMLSKQLSRIPVEGRTSLNITIGSNDVCNSEMTSVDDFAKEFSGALQGYVERKPDSIIYVSSIPNIVMLREMFKSNFAAQIMWDVSGFCSQVFSSEATSETRAMVSEQVQKFNEILANVCTQEFGDVCRWDNYALYNHKFSEEEISNIDYFHPSVKGQERLAQIVWDEGYTLF